MAGMMDPKINKLFQVALRSTNEGEASNALKLMRSAIAKDGIQAGDCSLTVGKPANKVNLPEFNYFDEVLKEYRESLQKVNRLEEKVRDLQLEIVARDQIIHNVTAKVKSSDSIPWMWIWFLLALYFVWKIIAKIFFFRFPI